MLRADLVRYLVNRLRYERDVAKHPEILDEDVSDPMIIVGLPRSGSTKLQRLMSVDSSVQGLWTWNAINPGLITDRSESTSARIALGELYAARYDQMKQSHAHVADAAEQDFFLLVQSFESLFQTNFVPAQRYLRWMRERSREPAYTYTKRMLQYLQWQDGGKKGRPWLLKSPVHIGALDVICDVYPRATLLYTYRNPVEIIQSYCYMMDTYWAPMYANLTPEFIGRHCLEYWGPEMARFARQRKLLGKRLDMVSVPYERIVREPIEVAREFHARAGRELSAEAIRAMAAWDNDNEQYKFGRPEYSLSRYGLTEAEILAALDPEGLTST
jgi:hypothetical protein